MAPDYIPALESAGAIEYRTGNAAATGHLERLLALRPDEETAHAMLAVLAWKRGECARAVAHFNRSKQAIASQPEAVYGFGACLLKLKRPEDASHVFQGLVSAHPEDRWARYALAVSLM